MDEKLIYEMNGGGVAFAGAQGFRTVAGVKGFVSLCIFSLRMEKLYI